MVHVPTIRAVITEEVSLQAASEMAMIIFRVAARFHVGAVDHQIT